MTTINIPSKFNEKDSDLDAFGRLRVSDPSYVFDAQLTYNLQPLLYEQITAETGASVAHSATNRNALMTFTDTPNGGKAYMQSFDHCRYQPGRSLRSFITFSFVEEKANVLKFAGVSTGANGVELRLNGSQLQIAILSDTDSGDLVVNQSDWNLDPLDGSKDSESGLVLDVTKQQILVIELQALYSGRVKCGFDIDGKIIYFHIFEHANIEAGPYIQTANLPVRCGMTCSGTVSTTMTFTCASVISEGGQHDAEGLDFSFSGSVTAGSGARTHAVSIRPKALFNSIENRTRFVLKGVSILAGLNPVKWELVLGQAITGTTTFADANTTYSSTETNTAGTLSGNPAIVVDSGYVGSSASANESTDKAVHSRYPITLDAAGVARANGTLTLLLTGIGGTSACQYSLNWYEIR